ncbi:hypothetical protein R6Z07M_009010 [Ovis aries]
MCKLRPLLQKWVEEADNNENLQEIGKAETLVQARKRKRSIENRVRGNLESMFLQCPKATLQQISHIAQQLGLEKDVVRVWFCSRRQKGKRSSSDYSQRKDFEAAGSPFAGGPGPMLTTGWEARGFGGHGFSLAPAAPGPRRRPAPPPPAAARQAALAAPQVTCGRVASPAARSALRPARPRSEAGAAAPRSGRFGRGGGPGRGGAPQPSRRPRSAASSLPRRRAFGACREASLSRGRGARTCNWMRFSEPRLPVHLAEMSQRKRDNNDERSRFIRKLKRRKEAFIPNNLSGTSIRMNLKSTAHTREELKAFPS